MRFKPIEQQVVVVVGANSGIGRATALRFAERGAQLVVAGRSLPALQSLADEITGRGGRAAPVEVDVSEFDQVKNLADQAVSIFGRIDTWVHLAAVTLYATFEETKPEEFKRVIDINLLGQVYGAMAALPYLKREGRGALIHISSIEARRALPLHSPYSASKHGMRGFLDSLRMELEHQHVPISVANIMPASINTPLFDKALTRLGVKPQPLPPVYHPDLVADAILYAAEHPVRDLYVGGAGKMFGLMQRLSPRLADKLLGPVAFPGQHSDQPKSANAPNNLYQHIDGYDTILGTVPEQAKPVSVYTWLKTHPAARWGAAATLLAAGAVLSGRALRERRKPGLLRSIIK